MNDHGSWVRLYSEHFKDGEGVIGRRINIGILVYLLSLGDSSVLTASDQDHLSREIWDVLLRIESRGRHLCEREGSRGGGSMSGGRGFLSYEQSRGREIQPQITNYTVYREDSRLILTQLQTTSSVLLTGPFQTTNSQSASPC